MSHASDTAGRIVEVAVVGAGPAGMAAAARAAEAGCQVVVVDSYATAGGQYHRSHAEGLGPGERPAPVVRFLELVRSGRVELRSGTTVWTAEALTPEGPFRLHLTSPDDSAPATLTARSVVITSGAFDRTLPFPGWDLPGVFTAGGAQALLKGQGVLVGRRAVVGGSGPFLLPVAAGLADAGCEVLEVVEAQPVRALPTNPALAWRHRDKLAEATGYARTLARQRVPFRTGSAVIAVRGEDRVEEVVVAKVDRSWRPRPGTERALAADAVCVSFGFVPQVGLAALLGCELGPDPLWGDPAVRCDEQQATSVPNVFAAGEVTGVTGSDGAAAEGAIAGVSAAAALGRLDRAAVRTLMGDLGPERARHRDFAALLARAYRVPDGWVGWLRDDTVICRCEEVPYERVRAAVDELAASDLRSVKMTTRCGMGYCQGRVCGQAVATIVRTATGAPAADAAALSSPPVLTPVPLGHVAALGEDGDDEDPTASS